MAVPQEIIELVERFAHNRDLYRRANYNEAQVRQEFIDPFFAALGWDVGNRRGLSPNVREVVIETSLRTGRPDYCFYAGKDAKFYVEAKKPSVDVLGGISPAHQLRSYAWSSKLPLSILTDFEEFSVYDCRIPPKATDKAATARTLYLPYDQYADQWDKIAAVFSRDAVYRGDYDRYAEMVKDKRATQEVDDVFLRDLEEWRALLARNIALRNLGLDAHRLNYAVQMILDRIIFLRICEDRGIEPPRQLKDNLAGEGVYNRLVELFHRADARYNSGLFYFDKERGREDPDGLTPTLSVDDNVLRDIINSLYYPKSPYAFDVMSADILGSVYERFLGSTIRLQPSGRAKVEQKPEVRKAGGVYYTPKYIVEYIVKNTVGKLCEGKTPKEIASLRILDPACGSGSFLLGAYEYLLDYHVRWYLEHPAKRPHGEIYEGMNGQWHLTPQVKRQILLNNLYGVDIDPQAVEVTKLSLLLKVLEGETAASLATQLELMPERALPDLAANIKCGNSLIGPDFYEGKQMSLLDEEEMQRIKPFDWRAEFPQVFTPAPTLPLAGGGGKANLPGSGVPPLPSEGEGRGEGGFDAVIGNPPWVSLKGKFANDICGPDELAYLTQTYAGDTYRPNLYEYFVKRAISLTKQGGLQAFIVPDRLGFNEQFSKLRTVLVTRGKIMALLYKARFPGVIADTLVYVYTPEVNPEGNVVDIGEFHGARMPIPQDRFRSFQDCQFLPITPIVEKLYFKATGLERLCDVVSTSVGFIAKAKTISDQRRSSEQMPVLRGRNILRYNCRGEAYFHFVKRNLVGGTQDEGKLKVRRKILVRKTGYPLPATLDETARYPEQSLYFLYAPLGGIDLAYVAGVVNSKLFQHVYWSWMITNREATPQLKKIHLDEFPIRTINFSDPADVARHDRMVALVERMLDLHKRLATAQTPNDKTLLQRQITATDKEIDGLVYDLYGLTEDEIAVVEGMG